ncbi:MAG: aminomethyl-transferring glycine dehydrogenase [Magnetococcales bacterium]|nr:aminomethyl-transferring glycine dehydrogenase [Magnetococcales bacterium]|tara:strand:- start:367 stop:1653 length:1287 start_codon:yes stop_codon:yes gene_type:complete
MRYQPHTANEIKEMLKNIGAKNVNGLYNYVPQEVLLTSFIEGLPMGQSEMDVEADMQNLAEMNHQTSDGPFFLGAGYYRHHIPATVDYIIQRGEFLTSYTPYQPEVAQGTLMAIFEFQSYIAKLTGQEIANASMYDGATSLAEAVLMVNRIQKSKKTSVCIPEPLHPHYKETLSTYLTHTEIKLDAHVSENTSSIIVQYPNFHGEIPNLEKYRKICDDNGALLIVCINEIVSLGLLPAPSCADIVVGEAQSIGIPLSYGGPALGFFACKKEYIRQLPGRIVGKTEDASGKRSFVLTLNTREQHIRRDKATSNICTNEGLCALAFTVHVSLLGETGFKKLALVNHAKAQALVNELKNIKGIKVLNKTYFNEFVIQTETDVSKIITHLQESGIIAGYEIAPQKMLVCATEMTTQKDVQQFTHALSNAINL